MKTLIVYYSRSGVTRTVAHTLAKTLGADVEELVDLKRRTGAIGWLGAGKDASLKRQARIETPTKDPAAYDLVVIGTPVWAFTMTPAVRTYVVARHGSFKKVAFFCTMGGSGDEKTFRHMTEVSGTTPVATATFIDKQVKSGAAAEKISAFAAKLTGA